MKKFISLIAFCLIGPAYGETAAKAIKDFPLKSSEEITFIAKDSNPAATLLQSSSFSGSLLRSNAKNKALGILSVFQFQKEENKMTPARCEKLVSLMVGTLNKNTRKLDNLEISIHEGKSYCFARIINTDPKLSIKERLVVVRGMPTGLYGFVAKLSTSSGEETAELKEFVLSLK